ncbi:MAG: hypothetical protein JSW40_05800, partial [Candidatus Omnitrophota bacterium]
AQQGDVWIAGDVGIGTTTPTGILHVEGGDARWVISRNGRSFQLHSTVGPGVWNHYPWIGFYNSVGTRGMFLGYGTPGSHIDMMLTNGNNLAIRGGNVGIGRIDPSQSLDVNGGIQIGNSTVGEAGAIRWTGSEFQGHNGTNWAPLGGGLPDVIYALDPSVLGGLRVTMPAHGTTPHFPANDQLVLRVPVRTGDVVKVTFAGSIGGTNCSGSEVYTGIWLRAGPGVSITGSSGTIQAWGHSWKPFNMVGFWRATGNGVLVFKQGYYKSDLGGTQTRLTRRVAFAEKVNLIRSQ